MSPRATTVSARDLLRIRVVRWMLGGYLVMAVTLAISIANLKSRVNDLEHWRGRMGEVDYDLSHGCGYFTVNGFVAMVDQRTKETQRETERLCERTGGHVWKRYAFDDVVGGQRRTWHMKDCIVCGKHAARVVEKEKP
jgi:hypothetical protein